MKKRKKTVFFIYNMQCICCKYSKIKEKEQSRRRQIIKDVKLKRNIKCFVVLPILWLFASGTIFYCAVKESSLLSLNYIHTNIFVIVVHTRMFIFVYLFLLGKLPCTCFSCCCYCYLCCYCWLCLFFFLSFFFFF